MFASILPPNKPFHACDVCERARDVRGAPCGDGHARAPIRNWSCWKRKSWISRPYHDDDVPHGGAEGIVFYFLFYEAAPFRASFRDACGCVRGAHDAPCGDVSHCDDGEHVLAPIQSLNCLKRKNWLSSLLPVHGALCDAESRNCEKNSGINIPFHACDACGGRAHDAVP